MDIFALSFVVDRESHEHAQVLLAISMDLILVPNCRLLYLRSNDINNFRSVLLKNSYLYIIDIKNTNSLVIH